MVAHKLYPYKNNSHSVIKFPEISNSSKRKLVQLELKFIPQIKAKWEQILADYTTDRQQAEMAIQACYAFAGLTSPRIIWAENPLNAILVLVNRPDLVSVSDKILQKIWDSCHQEITQKIEPESIRVAMAQANPRAEIVGDISNIKFDPWGDYFNSLLMRQIPKLYPDYDLAKLPTPMQDYRIAYLSYLDYFHSIGIDIPQIDLLIDLARFGGWCWAFENMVIVTPKPTTILFNEQNELTAIDYDGVNMI